MVCFYNDTSLPFIGKEDSHLLQHISTTKVVLSIFLTLDLEAKKSKKYRKNKIQVL